MKKARKASGKGSAGASKGSAAPRKGQRAGSPTTKGREARANEGAFYRPFSKLQAGSSASGKKTKVEPPVETRPVRGPSSEETPRAAESESFAAYMGGVRTLDPRAGRIPKTASSLPDKSAPPSADDLDGPARERLRALVLEGVRFEVSDDGERMEGRRIDVDPRELRRLRRGQYAVDGQIDLHGKTGGEAREAVEAFVRKRRGDGDRAVLIVCGKGTHSPRGQGVLRGEIAAWLSQGPLAAHVAAFASPPDDLGGVGAVLVLLAR